jgi:hypothetical protein
MSRKNLVSAWWSPVFFGKGPSLDLWLEACPPKAFREVRVCFNQVIQVVPEPDVYFAGDRTRWSLPDPWPAECVAVTQDAPRHVEALTERGVPPGQILTYRPVSLPEFRMLLMRREAREQSTGMVEALPPTLPKAYVSPVSAWGLMHLLGCRDLTLVGLDGGGGYARAKGPWEAQAPMSENQDAQYVKGRNALVGALEEWGWTWRDWAQTRSYEDRVSWTDVMNEAGKDSI